MSNDHKFGTFGGVFTPSILTILGVILYMRLPWIVGNAGLWATLGIIIVAHVISITTGLSVAAIATDKKVKMGGNYFIISRSLGLSVGGTLGLALFAGLAASISLYVIGFCESFLPVLGFPVNIHSIRIAGTISLVILTILIFISTSLAIKAQYIILSAVGLSLISIFFSSGVTPAEPHYLPLGNAPSVMILFGIFFPAVTGFTAGVQMSGDLRDPKRSIPIGTLAAIGTGLLVYIGLTLFFVYQVDAQTLVSNSNIISQIAWIGPLVLAGIWGATLSSAIGSLLGAPRILQAMSRDNITHSFFGRGFGNTNEPRTALILTFIIAEAGILLGELNMIARIVTIFFITTYGVLNFSFAVENWASSDFRPSFKVPTWVGVIGAAASFLVMYQLDALALVGATLLLGLVYLWIKRKHLRLETGDAWEAVWSSMVRSGLEKLSRTFIKERNWRPNIILFSGGTTVRPHLVEFGKWLVQKRGLLTNFDLSHNENAKNLQVIPEPVTGKVDHFPGFFSRCLESPDIYDGMKEISRIYGFSGIEPNTVFMGWAKNTREPARFSDLMQMLQKFNYNILLLKYDQESGFGKKKRVDVWWRGGSNNATFALNIFKFLQASDDWNETLLRILIMVEDSSLINMVYRGIIEILEDRRIEAEVKVINNRVEKLPVMEIIQAESAESDLTILGLPIWNEKEPGAIIKRMDSIITTLRTTLLIHASDFFPPLYVGIEVMEQSMLKSGVKDFPLADKIIKLEFPQNRSLREKISRINQAVERVIATFSETDLPMVMHLSAERFRQIRMNIITTFDQMQKSVSIDNRSSQVLTTGLNEILQDMLDQLNAIINEDIPLQKKILSNKLNSLLNEFGNIDSRLPKKVRVFYGIDEIRKIINVPLKIRIKLAFRKQNETSTDDFVSIPFPMKQYFADYYHSRFISLVRNSVWRMVTLWHEEQEKCQSIVHRIGDTFMAMQNQLNSDEFDPKQLDKLMKELRVDFKGIEQTRNENIEQNRNDLLGEHRKSFQDHLDILSKNKNRILSSRNFMIKKSTLQLTGQIPVLPDAISKKNELLIRSNMLEFYLMQFENRIRHSARHMIDKIEIEEVVRLTKGYELLRGFNKTNRTDKNTIPDLPESIEDSQLDNLDNRLENLRKVADSLLEHIPETIEIFDDTALTKAGKAEFDIETGSRKIYLRRHILHDFTQDFLDPLKIDFSDFKEILQASLNERTDLIRLAKNQAELPGTEGKRSAEISALNKESLQRIDNEMENIQLKFEDFKAKNHKLIQRLFDHLNRYLITHSNNFLVKPQEKNSKNIIIKSALNFRKYFNAMF